MTLRVAVDFGTSSTCIALSMHGREPEVVVVDGRPLLSSAVYAAPDGTLFVGQEAERQAAVDPSRFEPNPKRRVDEVELLLGDSVVRVRDVIRAVLSRAVEEARRVAGGAAVDQLVLTHPADWGGIRARVLRQAANGLSERIVLVPEPVAAAVFHAATFAQPSRGGEALAVLDVGGGTVDVSVVRRDGPSTQPGQGFHVLATRGDPSFGGADVDQALLQHVGSLVSKTDPDAWRELVEGRELADRRRRRVVWQDVRGAKETLSRHTYTDVPMPPPFSDAHVTRADLEQLIAGPLGRAAELTAATIREAGLTPSQLTAIFLVGGSSRIPMVARLVHERTGVIPTTLDQPETVVARGALRAIAADSEHSAGVPGSEITEMDLTRPDMTRPITPARRIPHQQAPFPQGTPPATGPRPPSTPVSGQPAARPPATTYPSTPPRGEARPWNRTPWLIAAMVTVIAAVVIILVVTSDEAPPPPEQGRVISQYDYRFTMPSDWEQVGGDASKRETQVKPVGAGARKDAIVVQEFELTYDSDADRQRALRQLRADYEKAGANFSGLDESASFAGRDVVYYRQTITGATVDWFVLFKGNAQVSVGCQYTETGRDRVHSACEQVVRTMTIG